MIIYGISVKYRNNLKLQIKWKKCLLSVSALWILARYMKFEWVCIIFFLQSSSILLSHPWTKCVQLSERRQWIISFFNSYRFFSYWYDCVLHDIWHKLYNELLLHDSIVSCSRECSKFIWSVVVYSNEEESKFLKKSYTWIWPFFSFLVVLR